MRKTSGGIFFILLIPIGFVILIYLYDFCQQIYFQVSLDKAVKETLTKTLKREGLETYEDYREYAVRTFKDMDYATDDMSLIQKDDFYVLVNYKNYTSVVGELSFGLLRTKQKMVHSAYKGFYNEYKEVQVEKFKEDEESLIEDISNEDEEFVLE